MTINIFVLKGDLNGKIVVVRFFFCWVYFLQVFALNFLLIKHKNVQFTGRQQTSDSMKSLYDLVRRSSTRGFI